MTAAVTNSDVHPHFDLPLVHDLLSPDRARWSPRQLRELTSMVVSVLPSHLHTMLRFDEDQRWWTRLALTEGVELWLLSWTPGQGTRPHDHGGAAGSFAVLLGEITEDHRYPGGAIRTARHKAGASVAFGPGRAHVMHNTGRSNAASVHAYSPPLLPVRNYASLHELSNIDTVST